MISKEIDNSLESENMSHNKVLKCIEDNYKCFGICAHVYINTSKIYNKILISTSTEVLQCT